MQYIIQTPAFEAYRGARELLAVTMLIIMTTEALQRSSLSGKTESMSEISVDNPFIYIPTAVHQAQYHLGIREAGRAGARTASTSLGDPCILLHTMLEGPLQAATVPSAGSLLKAP